MTVTMCNDTSMGTVLALASGRVMSCAMWHGHPNYSSIGMLGGEADSVTSHRTGTSHHTIPILYGDWGLP